MDLSHREGPMYSLVESRHGIVVAENQLKLLVQSQVQGILASILNGKILNLDSLTFHQSSQTSQIEFGY